MTTPGIPVLALLVLCQDPVEVVEGGFVMGEMCLQFQQQVRVVLVRKLQGLGEDTNYSELIGRDTLTTNETFQYSNCLMK